MSSENVAVIGCCCPATLEVGDAAVTVGGTGVTVVNVVVAGEAIAVSAVDRMPVGGVENGACTAVVRATPELPVTGVSDGTCGATCGEVDWSATRSTKYDDEL